MFLAATHPIVASVTHAGLNGAAIENVVSEFPEANPHLDSKAKHEGNGLTAQAEQAGGKQSPS